MAKQMTVRLKGKPTAFTRFILEWWVLALMLLPFVRFMPVRWFVIIETEVES